MPVVTVRMDEPLKAGLKELAHNKRLSMEETVRRFIRDAIGNSQKAIEASAKARKRICK